MAEGEPDEVVEEEEDDEEDEEEEEEPADDGTLKFDEDGNVLGVDEAAGAPEAEAAAAAAETSAMGVRRHERSSPYGGMLNAGGADDAGLRSVVLGLVKEMGKKLMSGQLDLLSVSLPVGLFESRSYLVKMTDVWCYPHMLDMALACYQAGDFVQGMKWIVAFNVAGCHHAFDHMKKPFNPVLGETFQGAYAGTKGVVNLEQISHHPPVTAFKCVTSAAHGVVVALLGCVGGEGGTLTLARSLTHSLTRSRAASGARPAAGSSTGARSRCRPSRATASRPSATATARSRSRNSAWRSS